VAGSPETGRRIIQDISSVTEDPEHDLDHGAWAILRHISPKSDIPVVELSIDMTKPLDYHWDLARQLYRLRKQGVLIIGSGNIVHNLELSMLKMATLSKKPYHWAVEFDQWVKERIDARDVASLFLFQRLGKIATLAVPTSDHYIPLLYSLALAEQNDPITYTYEEVIAGVSMRCLRIG
jgi:4,5-DOPA dioxygenase extradiol